MQRCGTQGDGESVFVYESFHGWQHLVRLCWLPEDKPTLSLPKAAAQLQSFYYTWILPFERWIMHEYSACTATARVPAQVVRRLALDRGHDSVLTHAVKGFGAVAQGPTEGYNQCVAGRHDLSLDDGALDFSLLTVRRVTNLEIFLCRNRTKTRGHNQSMLLRTSFG
jgi:hypothetical protein